MVFIFSILIMCIAHIIRVQRWKQFIRIYEYPDMKRLVQALSIGFLLNMFLPFKLGDLFRAWMSGRKMKNGVGFATATVIVDRYLDILVVGIIFSIIKVFNLGTDTSGVIVFYSCLSLIALIGTVLLCYFRKYVKRLLKMIASIFNYKIEFAILKFCFSLISSFKDIKKVEKKRLLFNTIGMWGMYLLSYFCFSQFLSRLGSMIKTVDIFCRLFEKDSLLVGGLRIPSMYGETGQRAWFIIFLCSPVILLLIVSFKMDRPTDGIEEKNDYLNLIPYLNEKDRFAFLELYFESKKSSYVNKYLEVNRNVVIINDFSAGSNATTMLCMDNKGSFYRKYAFGIDGEKLYDQIKWLQRFQENIPLTKIIKFEKEEDFCYYDMLYDSRAVGFFNYAHSMSKENAWKIVKKLVECLEKSMYSINCKKANKQSIDRYIYDKVTKNIGKIMSAKHFKKLMEFEEVIINGKAYKNLSFYLHRFEKGYLYEIFKNDDYSEIHGDLTVENVICIRNSEREDDFYIIDPNTGNIHDSSNLDYAKLLQSLHGGYEFLMATKNVEINQNRINYIFTKSETYTYLFHMLDSYMIEKFSRERVKSIYYHEIIHWLRLLPYKIEKDGKRALLFYAGMLIVMNDIENKFGEEWSL